MKREFEDKYAEVLESIETTIVDLYQDHPELTDFGVDKALAGLLRVYQAQLTNHRAPKFTLKELEQQVYNAVSAVCDRWLKEDAKQQAPLTLDEMVACLKRLRRSISLWTKQSGRQGYLFYITSFLNK